MLNKWEGNESVTHHYTRIIILAYPTYRENLVAIESLSPFIVGQEVEVSCVSNVRIVRREEPLNVTTSRQRGGKKSCCKGERRRKKAAVRKFS